MTTQPISHPLATAQSFDQWMEQVNQHLESALYLASDDLPDIDYASLFEDDYTPIEAAQEAITYAGEGFLDEDQISYLLGARNEPYDVDAAEYLPDLYDQLALGMGGYESDLWDDLI